MSDELDKAFDNWRETLDGANHLANDPFKAPEIVVESVQSVLTAGFRLQFEYAIMLRMAKAKR